MRAERAWAVLQTVLDPEVPALSVCDLGIVVDETNTVVEQNETNNTASSPLAVFCGQAGFSSISLTANRSTVPAGSYQHALVTREWTPLEPTVLENKWYGQGVGNVKARDVRGGNESSELVAVVHGS